jgi:hypothetical protein
MKLTGRVLSALLRRVPPVRRMIAGLSIYVCFRKRL